MPSGFFARGRLAALPQPLCWRFTSRKPKPAGKVRTASCGFLRVRGSFGGSNVLVKLGVYIGYMGVIYELYRGFIGCLGSWEFPKVRAPLGVHILCSEDIAAPTWLFTK